MPDRDRVEIESDAPPRPDDTERFRLAREERKARVKEAATAFQRIRLERESDVPITPTPALPVPDLVFGDVVDATPEAREVVLVLDDDEHYRAIWRRALARDGVELYLAATLGEALAVIESLRVLAVAVLDWQLPNGDGVHAAEAIAAKFPDAVCIVCSGYDSEERPNEAMRARFTAANWRAVFRPKRVAAREVRAGLRAPQGGVPAVDPKKK